MKKIFLVISGMIMLVTMATGCSNTHAKIEEDLINTANCLIEQKYEIKIDKELYTYELGEVVDKDKFVNIKEGEMPEVVFLRGVNKDKPSNGEMFDYYIKFNTVTDEIIDSECEVYYD